MGLEQYADTIAQHYDIKLHPQLNGYCTWYADQYGLSSDEVHLEQLAQFAAANLEPFGFNFIQIDDQWQGGISHDGPDRDFTTTRSGGGYPSGMKAMASQLGSIGLRAGIWFEPFAGTSYDPVYADHQDWFAKGPDGLPFQTSWGGTSLDMTEPGARAHVRDVVSRIAHGWGYKLFKMDGLYTGTASRREYVNNGYVDDHLGEATLSNPNVTNVEAYRSGLKLVRDSAGPDVFFVGCNVSQNMRTLGGSFGLLDSMRVGPDTGSGMIGALNASRLWFLNKRVWYNDPDSVTVRNSESLDLARLNASFTAVAGDFFYDSDWIPGLDPDRVDILKRCMPAHELPARPVDVFEHEPARIWSLTKNTGGRRCDLLAFYNWDSSWSTISTPLDRAGLLPAANYVAFDYWANKFVGPFYDSLSADLPPESCKVFAVHPASAAPFVLSTSRHVTQGMTDILYESWDVNNQSLFGSSNVVGGDRYEIRIVVPATPVTWKVAGVYISPSDTSAGVNAGFKQDGPRLRVTLQSLTSRIVTWRVKFVRSALVGEPAPEVTNLTASSGANGIILNWDDTADSYMVSGSDGFNHTTALANIVDTLPKSGDQITYTVTALGWTHKPGVPATVLATR